MLQLAPDLAFSTAARCAAQRSEVLEAMATRIDVASLVDSALLLLPHGDWRGGNTVAFLHSTSARMHAFLAELRVSVSQCDVCAHILRLDRPIQLSGWLRRRLRTMLNRAPAEGEVQPCLARLRICFQTFRSFVALTLLRVIGNAWPTIQRIGGMLGRCLYGCMASGGDDLLPAHVRVCATAACLDGMLGTRRPDASSAFHASHDAAGFRGRCRLASCCPCDILLGAHGLRNSSFHTRRRCGRTRGYEVDGFARAGGAPSLVRRR